MKFSDDAAGWLPLATATARAAGALVQAKAAESFGVMHKGFRDVVTNADYESQRLIVDAIREQFPTHGFLAEEKDPGLTAGRQVLWVIDPIDGTSNYSRRIPLYCISIAAVVAGRVEVGVVYDPVRDELFSARRGHGATLNGAALGVSRVEPLDAALIAFDWSRPEALRNQVLAMLGVLAHRAHTLRALGSTALALAWLAAGRIDGYFNLQPGACDVAAGSLLLAEAGGQLGATDGRPFAIDDRATWAVASNGHIHAELCAALVS